MRTQTILVCLSCALAAGGGCGDNIGLLLRPVRLDRRLKEQVVQTDPGWVTAKIALVEVDGLIVNQRSSWLFDNGENPVSLFAEKLDAAGRDDAVKAVVLRINSPGGTVQATEAMHRRLARFRSETHKPVIACITDVGASGAYYLACGCKQIVAQPTSITGSIGVIIQTVSFAGTMKMLGIRAEAITSGRLKDMGSPLKDLTEQERRIFQEMVSAFYEGFVAHVARGRKELTVEQVRKLADGRVYTGQQARRLKLIDRLGGLQDAIAQAKSAAGVERAKVVMYHRPSGYRANVYSAASPAGPTVQFNLLNLPAAELTLLRRPSFLYLWTTDLAPASRKTPWP